MDDEFLTKLWFLKNQPKEFWKDSDYPDWVKEIFVRNIRVREKVVVPNEQTLEEEVNSLIAEIKDMANAIDEVDDVGDKIAYFRLRTSLADKLLSLKERTVNVALIVKFMQEVTDILDQVLGDDPKKRAEVMERLEAFKR